MDFSFLPSDILLLKVYGLVTWVIVTVILLIFLAVVLIYVLVRNKIKRREQLKAYRERLKDEPVKDMTGKVMPKGWKPEDNEDE